MSSKNVLSHEEITKLIIRAHAGDKEAIEEIYTCNIALVKSIVKRYIGRGCDYDDLLQIGSLGLIKAIENYDLSYEVRFSTYAVPMIAGEIKRFLRDDGAIKVSRSIKELGIRALSVRERLMRENSGEVTVADIASELSCSVDDVVFAMEAMRPPISIYEPVYDAGTMSDVVIADRIAEESSVEETVINDVFLKEMLSSLKPRDRQIIMLRYFEKKTQTEVAKLLGISQVQVSRLENKIISGLRESFATF